jgi:hypothetical protein
MKKSDFKKDCEYVKEEFLRKNILNELKEIEKIIEDNGRIKEYPLTHNQLVNVLYDIINTKEKNL